MKRIICSAFVLVLLLSACTTPGAEVIPTPEPTPTEEATPTVMPEPAAVTWSFDEDTKTLTFSGEGSLPDGVEDPVAWNELHFEWEALADVAEALVFEEGIIRIPGSAFYGFSHVTEVRLPSTMQIIEPWAFSGCAFEEIDLPEGLEELGEGAFASCGNLLRCEIPASVLRLPNHLFWECRKLETVTLHEGLYSIGPECFGACDKLERLVVPASVSWLGNQNIPYSSTGIRAVVFLGPPPAPMLEPDVGYTIMDCLPQNLTIYYPESETEPGDQGKYWSDYAEKYDGYTWIAGVPEDMEKAAGLF